MDQELIDLISKSGIKISKIEIDCIIPKNSLSGMISGSRPTTKKAEKALLEYFAKKTALSSPTGGLDFSPSGVSMSVPDPELMDKRMKFLAAMGVIEAYCEAEKITPEYLIECHKKSKIQPKTVVVPPKEQAAGSKIVGVTKEMIEPEPGTNAFYLRNGRWS